MVKKIIKTTVTEEIVDTTPEIVVALLIDESGSMLAQTHDTIVAINSYVAKLKEDEKTRELKFVLKTFSSLRHQTLYRGGRVKDVPLPTLTHLNYLPNGGTPLYDAMGELIEELRAEGRDKVLFTILTDGQENTSRKYTREHIADKIKATGWEFNFLGANFDAYAESHKLGISAQHTVNFTMDKMAATPDCIFESTQNYVVNKGATGTSAYSGEMKRKLGDTTAK